MLLSSTTNQKIIKVKNGATYKEKFISNDKNIIQAEIPQGTSHILIEFEIAEPKDATDEPSVDHILLADLNSEPSIKQETAQEIQGVEYQAQYGTFESWYMKKYSGTIWIDLEEHRNLKFKQRNFLLYMRIYNLRKIFENDDKDREIEYTIRVDYGGGKEDCSRDCKRGVCKELRCACFSGFIGNSCDYSMRSVKEGYSEKHEIAPLDISFFYIEKKILLENKQDKFILTAEQLGPDEEEIEKILEFYILVDRADLYSSPSPNYSNVVYRGSYALFSYDSIIRASDDAFLGMAIGVKNMDKVSPHNIMLKFHRLTQDSEEHRFNFVEFYPNINDVILNNKVLDDIKVLPQNDSALTEFFKKVSFFPILGILFLVLLAIKCCCDPKRAVVTAEQKKKAKKNMMTAKVIFESCKQFKYKEETEDQEITNLFDQEECSICLTAFEVAERVKLINKCKHIFHSKCLHKWLKSKLKCPLCNQDLQIKASAFKELMRIAKIDSEGNLDPKDKKALDDMMSKDSKGESYSVEVDISQMLNHDINSSIHYASNRSGSNAVRAPIIIDENEDQENPALEISNLDSSGLGFLKAADDIFVSDKSPAGGSGGIMENVKRQSENRNRAIFFSEREEGDGYTGSVKNVNSIKFSMTDSKNSNIKPKMKIKLGLRGPSDIKEDPSEFQSEAEDTVRNKNRRFRANPSKENLSKIESEGNMKKNLSELSMESNVFFRTLNENSKDFDNGDKVNLNYENNVQRVMKQVSVSVEDCDGAIEGESSDTVYLFGDRKDKNVDMSKDTNKKRNNNLS